MEQKGQRADWIDAAKLVAILGVLVDHTQNVLYSNHRIADCSYYSVGLFIFLMGVTGYGSYSRYRGSIPEKLKKNFWKIARPYLVATFIFSIAQDGQFTFLAFWKRLLYFNASAPFYYVALYLQLMVVIPVFAALLRMTSTKKGGIFLEMLVFGATVVLSAWTTNHSNILDIYGGGGRLLGGSYLILCYLGMLFGKYRSGISVKPPVAILAWIAGIWQAVRTGWSAIFRLETGGILPGSASGCMRYSWRSRCISWKKPYLSALGSPGRFGLFLHWGSIPYISFYTIACFWISSCRPFFRGRISGSCAWDILPV